VVAEVKRRLGPQQLEIFTDTDGVSDVVAKTTAQVVLGTIDIPRIVVLLKDDVRSGFKPFKLDLTSLRYPVPSDELVAQTLRTGEQNGSASAAAASRSSGWRTTSSAVSWTSTTCPTTTTPSCSTTWQPRR
jgi:hypothetical protein